MAMAHLLFSILVVMVAIISGAVAALGGFGIGSLLTPLLATAVGMKVAVAAVSLPHFVATSVRLWGLRKHVDRSVLVNFGILSAAGGLLGALFQWKSNSPILGILFGLLLLFAGVSGLTGWSDRMHFGRRTAWLGGALSGFFGGVVGNQGGIRSALINEKRTIREYSQPMRTDPIAVQVFRSIYAPAILVNRPPWQGCSNSVFADSRSWLDPRFGGKEQHNVTGRLLKQACDRDFLHWRWFSTPT
jgi:hypothetical protein